ncbi:hypothetical protein [Pseudomonas sp. OTU750018]|uniref:hypothetical protein n=1 Tax=Pseudomonas sp. OTU750018 TaxID=2709708 RepID=UPI001421BBDD|nr:hypothetical protein [Pseudomonas sp. OTU750018]
MHFSVKRRDKLQGHSDLPVTVKVQTYDEDLAEEDEFEKQILDGEIVTFEFDAHEFDVTCFVGEWQLDVWPSLTADDKDTLTFGIKKSNIDVIRYHESDVKAALETKQKLEREAEQQQVAALKQHASQIIDRKKVTIAALLALFILAPAVFGSLMAHDQHNEALRNFLIVVALVAFCVVGYIAISSGLHDNRCDKCNSNLVRIFKTDEKFRGTYSSQEHVMDRNTREMSWRQVVKTDFDISDYYCCDLCKHQWTNRYIRTTSAN